MVRILSIDVGVRNLGACEIEHETGGDAIKIGFWGVIVNPRESDSVQAAIAGAVDAVRELDSLSGGFGWDHVLVENQPCMKNPRMKAVQTALHAMLVATYGEGVDVRMAGAAGKNRIADEILGDRPATPGYRANKRRAVDAARAFLAARGMKDDLAALDASGKKDDIQGGQIRGGSEASDNVMAGVTDEHLSLPQSTLMGGGSWFNGGLRTAIPASTAGGGKKKTAQKTAQKTQKKTPKKTPAAPKKKKPVKK